MDSIVHQIHTLSTQNESDLKKLKDFLRHEQETLKANASQILRTLKIGSSFLLLLLSRYFFPLFFGGSPVFFFAESRENIEFLFLAGFLLPAKDRSGSPNAGSCAMHPGNGIPSAGAAECILLRQSPGHLRLHLQLPASC